MTKSILLILANADFEHDKKPCLSVNTPWFYHHYHRMSVFGAILKYGPE